MESPRQEAMECVQEKKEAGSGGEIDRRKGEGAAVD